MRFRKPYQLTFMVSRDSSLSRSNRSDRFAGFVRQFTLMVRDAPASKVHLALLCSRTVQRNAYGGIPTATLNYAGHACLNAPLP